jgi:hypothetical protein
MFGQNRNVIRLKAPAPIDQPAELSLRLIRRT